MAAALLALGLIKLGRRSRVTVATVLTLFGMLRLWPFLDRRLVTPLIPWLALALALGALAASGQGDRPTDLLLPRAWRDWAWPRVWPSLAVAVWGIGFAGVSVWGLASGRHQAVYALRAPALYAAVDAVRSSTPVDAVIGAPELWAALHLYTGRTVAPSAPFRPGETPPWGTPVDQFRLWEAAGLDQLLVEHRGRVHGKALDALDRACPDGTVAVVTPPEDVLLVRLTWTATCREAVLGGV